MVALWSLISSVLGSFAADWTAGRQNKRDVEKAVADNRIRLAQDQQSHNNEWEMRALEGRDTWLRRLSFAAWSAPMVWAYFDPTAAAAYFSQSLSALPDWYVGGYLGITGAIWGLVELKAAGVIKR
jgi:hypothetical protein